MRFELRSQEEDAFNYLSRPKEQQRTTLRSHYHTKREQSITALALHHLITLGLDKKFPATRTHMQRGVFCFHGREKWLEKGE